MVGKQGRKKALFVVGVNLEERVREDHPLPRIQAAVDFSFVRKRAAHLCGYNENVSVDPEVIMKPLWHERHAPTNRPTTPSTHHSGNTPSRCDTLIAEAVVAA